MILFIIILYFNIGFLIAFAYKYVAYSAAESGRYKRRIYFDKDQTWTAILSGVLWPIAAPLSFAVHFSRLYADSKDSKRGDTHD